MIGTSLSGEEERKGKGGKEEGEGKLNRTIHSETSSHTFLDAAPQMILLKVFRS